MWSMAAIKKALVQTLEHPGDLEARVGILADRAQILTHFRGIQEVMAKLVTIAIGQHGNQFVVTGFKLRVGVDVEHRQLEIGQTWLAAHGFQRGEHVLAKVAVVAAV